MLSQLPWTMSPGGCNSRRRLGQTGGGLSDDERAWMGRRKISIGGYTGMAVAALIAAPSLLALTGTSRIIVVMVALNMFVASFAIGVGGTGWLIQGESFTTEIRGLAASIAAAVDWGKSQTTAVMAWWRARMGRQDPGRAGRRSRSRRGREILRTGRRIRRCRMSP